MSQTTAQNTVLIDRLWPGIGAFRTFVCIAMGCLLVALVARIEIPLYPVPITGQTFGVLIVAALLGRIRGTTCIISYLALGATGLPVFAGGHSGITAFFGPTAGYLFGFVLAAALVGSLCEIGWDRKFWTTVYAMSLGMVVIYASGVIWLSRFVGWEQVLAVGIIPFLIGDAIKVALAAVILPNGWALLGLSKEQ